MTASGWNRAGLSHFKQTVAVMLIKPEFCFGSVAYLYFMMIYYNIVSIQVFFVCYYLTRGLTLRLESIRIFHSFPSNPKRGLAACVINRRIPRSCLQPGDQVARSARIRDCPSDSGVCHTCSGKQETGNSGGGGRRYKEVR